MSGENGHEQINNQDTDDAEIGKQETGPSAVEIDLKTANATSVMDAVSGAGSASTIDVDDWVAETGKKLNSKDFYVFTPQEFYDLNVDSIDDSNIEELSSLIEHITMNRLKSKLPRVFVMLLIPGILIPLIHADPKSAHNIPIYFGGGLILMFIAYFIHLFFLFLNCNTNCKYNVCCDDREIIEHLKENASKVDRSGQSSTKEPIKELDIINNYLFRVYSLNSVVDSWTAMAVCFETIIFENEAIQSISEFSAIAGGFAQTMLLVLSIYSWVVLIAAQSYTIQHEDMKAAGVSATLEGIGCFGLVLIGTYELDPFNSTMQMLHNGGALLGVGTVFGYLYQQIRFAIKQGGIGYLSFLWSPIVLTIIAGASFVSWRQNQKKSDVYAIKVSETIRKNEKRKGKDKDNEDNEADEANKSNSRIRSPTSGGGLRVTDKNVKEEITKLTLMNVVSEAIFLFCGALSMCLYIMNIPRCFDMFGRNCY